jgi:TRAP-type mannitol/chloroaromatic compound transport system permease small subunit
MTNQKFLNNFMHYIAISSALCGTAFVLNNFLTYIYELPGLFGFLNHFGADFDFPKRDYSFLQIGIGAIQSLLYVLALMLPILTIRKIVRGERISLGMNFGAELIVASAFWSVMLIGIADAAISFVRIENLLPGIVGEELALSLGKPAFRGIYVHLPLMLIGIILGSIRRGIDFIWLASLIVFGELLIVITRFIFSYEQAFMGDLVRFWYAALFLFASAYTLVNDGHVRVDVLYAGFSRRLKALINIYGSLILGLPLCWITLTRGLWNESSPFNLALLNFEVTQQGFGMYVKYLMSGFLIIFALAMLFQFASFMIEELNKLEETGEHAKSTSEKVA